MAITKTATKKSTQAKKSVATEVKPVRNTARKVTAKKTIKTKLLGKTSQLQGYLLTLPQTARPTLNTIKNYRPSKRIYVALVIVGLLVLGAYNKNLFIAATVNGSPISNLELQNRLNNQYREQTLNQMVNEKIVMDEAKKKGIITTTADVNKQISTLEKNVGGPKALDELLIQQSQTRTSLKDQIMIQLTIEKMYANDATVSGDEVKQFIDQNKDQLQATTSAEQTKEAESAIKQQKLSQVFQGKFKELKQTAKIQIF